MYGIPPEFDSVQIVMANRSLLDKAGKKLSDVNGSDWEAMSKAATALTAHAGSGLSVIGVDTKLPEFLPLWAKANGGADLISADGRKAQLDDPKVVEALTWAARSTRTRAGSARSRRSATRPTSSAQATSSRPARSVPCRWSSGT